ncbi:MAG: hypothetical protein IJ681_07600 [Bacteroidales bacterium]|nr:hypothetical protein [Bacteroidales bacterium]
MDWNLLFNGITSISTLLMMMATCFVAYFAWKALDSWKNENITKKKCNTYLELLDILMDTKSIFTHIESHETIEKERLYSIVIKLLTIAIDFDHINERKNVDFIFKITDIIDKYNQKAESDKIEDDFCYAYLKNIDNIKKDLNTFLDEGRDVCKDKIKEFYKE